MMSRPIPFPAANRRSEVMQAAEMLNRTHGVEAVRAWTTLCRSMADQMLAAGVPEDEMRDQIMNFQHAVQIELQALSCEMAG